LANWFYPDLTVCLGSRLRRGHASASYLRAFGPSRTSRGTATRILCLVAILAVFVTGCDKETPGVTSDDAKANNLRLYWFLPDGLRAEPEVFKVYEWAREGMLPNIARLLEEGSSGYSIPVFPGHTPTNFATLFTGATPKVHGVADGPMRLQRYPLSIVSKSGFSSHAKLVPPIWYSLERENVKVALLSVPGSTPPELSAGITIKGRWGGWGVEFASVNFHNASDTKLRREQGFGNRLFDHGQHLTRYVESDGAEGWENLPTSYSEPRQIVLENWGFTLYALVYDSIDDQEEVYDRVLISADRATPLADLGVGEWSDWKPVTLKWQTGNDYTLNTPKKSEWELALGTVNVDTDLRIRVIRLGGRDEFRIRFLYNGLNRFLAKPPEIADRLLRDTGPMVDYPDNFPPQLIYFDEDKETFLDEMRQSLDWHRRAAAWLIDETDAEVIVHDTYTPNQMLTSRWWMGYLDPTSPLYSEVDETTRSELWSEVMEMYVGIDRIVGEVLDRAGEDTWIILGSDHGAIPLHTSVNLNNLFAREGLLSYTEDAETGYISIDWPNTRVAHLKMDNIYINPDGLGGDYHRASGPAYLALRERVTEMLKDLHAPDGTPVVTALVPWEDAASLGLPGDRVGDLVVANRAGFGWSESITRDLAVFSRSPVSGYKQAVLPETETGMWTPFVVFGPGVRRGHTLSAPVRHVDQYPTIMTLLGMDIPGHVEGKAIEELFDD
jgi:predicted AlkP superfamily phosphohydrolase/phosphomutase